MQPYVWKDYVIPDEGTPGYRIHGNPMYLARTLTLFWGELAAIMTDREFRSAGRAAW